MNNSKTILVSIALVPLLAIVIVVAAIGSDTGQSCAATPAGIGGPTGKALAGLNEAQLRLARDGVAIGKQRHEPAVAILAELAAQATESMFRNLANSNVPESLNYPRDGIGADHDSVGPHQMRAGIWGKVGMAELMRPQYQINWFYDQADKHPGGTDPAELAQAVEQSEPDVYARNLELARQIYALFAGTNVSQSSAGCGQSDIAALTGAAPSRFGATVVAAARRWIGTPYVWGGGDTRGPTRGPDNLTGFDCSGLTLYAVFQASGGRISLSHYTQSQQDDPRAMKVPFAQRRPGDLIYFTKPGEHDSHHVGIFAGSDHGTDLLLNAPATGQNIKLEPLTDWRGERMDIRRFG